jgi:hypothetical protein
MTTTSTDYGLTRRMWHQLEPIHAVFGRENGWRG